MIDLTKFGNFKDYTPKNRIVKSHEPVYVEDKAAVKLYTMLETDTKEFSDSQIEKVKNFMKGTLTHNRVDSEMGLGFAILSEDVLNLNFWGRNYPSIVTPNIYLIYPIEQEKIHTIVESKVDKVGAYCAWEGAIVGHESKVWRQYMHSNRTEQDKKLWLNDVYPNKSIIV